MDTLELTHEDIVDNGQIVISNINTAVTTDDGDVFHVYVGISATSLCKVDLEFTDGFTGETGYGEIYLERLTRQENMYAIHLALDSYLYTSTDPEYRDSEFFLTAYTCGELTKTSEVTISQKGCLGTCTVTWKTGNLVLKTDEVQIGAIPSYVGATPTKQNPQPGYSYSFSGWDPEPSAVSENTTYYAQFTETQIEYTIRWEMDDGSLIENQVYHYGDMPSHENPSKPDSEGYHYIFDRWSPSPSAVTGNATYRAVFTRTVLSYVVTWNNWDGTLLQRGNLSYGSTPVYTGATPQKASTVQYDYEFSGWSPATAIVTSDQTYTAQFNEVEREYEITWVFGNGHTPDPEVEVYSYGDTPSIGRPSDWHDNVYNYTFRKWDPSIEPVTDDATYTAIYDREHKSYYVTWIWHGGEDVQEEYVTYTPSHAYPPNYSDETYEYTCVGWNPEPYPLTGDTTYTARYDADYIDYDITWLMDDDSVIGRQQYHYGETPSYTAPTKPPTELYTYYFAGWNPSITTVTGDKVYKATYTAVINCRMIMYKTKGSDDYTSVGSNADFGDDITFESKTFYPDDHYGIIECDGCITRLNSDCGFYSNEEVVEVILPSSVTELNGGVFEDSDLKKADLRNIQKIGIHTFEHCDFYAIIVDAIIVDDRTPESANKINTYNNMGGCLIVSNNLKEVGYRSFSACRNLIEAEIPSSVTKISDRLFYDDDNLEKVSLPNTITEIGKEAFLRCPKLSAITIPTSVTGIGYGAFSGCESLTNITIPSSVTRIGVRAFEGCTALLRCSIPNRVTRIEAETFNTCTSLTAVTIPSSVTSIGESAFFSCSSLSAITIPNSVTNIAYGAFSHCSSLSAITIPTSITTIENNTFRDCTSLSAITIPDNVTSIDYSAFGGCTSLTSVTISSGVTYIGWAAFMGCNNLAEIKCRAITPPTIDEKTWYGVTKSIPLKVPSSAVNAYRNANYWRQFTNISEL